MHVRRMRRRLCHLGLLSGDGYRSARLRRAELRERPTPLTGRGALDCDVADPSIPLVCPFHFHRRTARRHHQAMPKTQDVALRDKILQELSVAEAIEPEEDVRQSLPGEFAAGRSLISEFPSIPSDPDMSDLYKSMTGPVITDLVAEFGPVTASSRMLIEAAAAAYVDGTLYVHGARQRVVKDRVPGNAAAAIACNDAAHRSFRCMRECLEMLRRPTPQNVQLRIDNASNVNLGRQTMKAPSRKRRRGQ